MADTHVQTQIDDINRKLDIILEEVYAQKQTRESLYDLADDVSIVGKDIFKNTVSELDKAGVEIDSDAIAGIGIKLIRNIGNINELLETMESLQDFIKDASPILHQVGLDAVHKMNALEEKGYFEFMREMGLLMDSIVTYFSKEDVKALADNIVFILETVKNLTQPDMLKAINNATTIYKNLDMEEVEEYSVFRAMKELRNPEIKKGIGFVMTFLKRMAEVPDKQENNNQLLIKNQ
jgi:uncharacterized protein YjgD (DUF1641 family)